MPKRANQSALPKTSETTSKARVRFIFEPDRTSPNGITFSWLIHNAYNGKEKAATAVRAFWLPFAYQESDNYSQAELQELAQQSVWRLEEQIQHLREAFGLEAISRLGSPALLTQSVNDAQAPSTLPDIAPPPITLSDAPLVPDQELLDEFNEVV